MTEAQTADAAVIARAEETLSPADEQRLKALTVRLRRAMLGRLSARLRAWVMHLPIEEDVDEFPEHQTWCWVSAIAWIVSGQRRPADELMTLQPAGYRALAQVLARASIVCDLRQVEKTLITALSNGDLRSRGVLHGELTEIDVPGEYWPAMEPWESPLGSVGAKTRFGVRPYRCCDTILLSAGDVMRVWSASPVAKRQSSDAPDDDVERAIQKLAGMLEADRDLKRDVAETVRHEFAVSQREFRNKVWPDARERVGLSRRAPAGAKAQKAR